MTCDIGIIGLGTMGANLALNLTSKGFSTAVYNRTLSVTEEFISKNRSNRLDGAKTIAEFCSKLSVPRKIILMVTAGEAVDSVIESLLPYLGSSDIIIDAGNSHFKDTQQRYRRLKELGIRYVGMGVSGGEEGALKGPSIMAGCEEDAWRDIEKIFISIAARDFAGNACAARLGNDGAGHFVKIVHNGIEYAFLELIAESYMLLKHSGMDNIEISKFFEELNKGKLSSYLFEITSHVLKKKEGDKYLVELILDKAEQKGTGAWAAQSALELAVPAYSIAIAPLVRFMSSLKEERREAAKMLQKNREKIKVNLSALADSLLASQLAAFSEGFRLIAAASDFYRWDTRLDEVARIWQGGCIIRSKLLVEIRDAFLKSPSKDMILYPSILQDVKSSIESLREIVSISVKSSLPVPAFAATLQYLETYFEENLPANLIQGLRDYFGSHGYRRIDKEGVFHTNWKD